MITLGVVADTHVPDRMQALPAAALEALQGVDAILHAGDVCVRPVLDTLALTWAASGQYGRAVEIARLAVQVARLLSPVL